MRIYSREDLDRYLQDDWIYRELLKAGTEEEEKIRTNIWLKEMDNKRMIYADVYGDILLGQKKSKRVLDVGGGYNALTKILAQNSDYFLLDYMAHGGGTFLSSAAKRYGIHWLNYDWFEVDEMDYDIVIANDIFPDVDQRMELFLERYLPRCKELRLVVTYYNTPKYYVTQRIDDAEKLTFLSWDGEIVALKLMKYADRIVDTSKEQIQEIKDSYQSIYRNGRQIAYLVIKGDLGTVCK